ncbi:MAG: BON domain-containing protein [Bryobacteraceae bacterium]|nr:BON domain-containing protein [Bryobacteraceae bacterium]
MSCTEQEAIYKKEERVMHTGKTYGKAILAGFVIAGALVLALPLPSQAQEKSFAGKSQSHPDPHYMDNKQDLRIKMDVKWELSMSPFVDNDHIHVTVRDGVVTLKGQVDSQYEFDAATQNAIEGGAKKVINLLTIQK